MMLMYEGKAKKIFKCTEDTVTMYFKDDATAGNRAKEAVFEGKGELNASISAKLLSHLHMHLSLIHI